MLDTHASEAAEQPANDNVVNKPSPAGIEEPVNETPKINSAPIVILKPASAAAPPDADSAVAPSKPNWKPPISSELE